MDEDVSALYKLLHMSMFAPCPLGWLYRSTHVPQNSSFDAYVISNDVRSSPLVHSSPIIASPLKSCPAKGRRRQITERNKKDCHTLFMCSCCCCCIWDSLLFQRVENPTGGKLSRLHPIYINETNYGKTGETVMPRHRREEIHDFLIKTL